MILIAGGGHQILESDRAPFEIGEGKRHVTLTPMARVVDCDEQPLAILTLPRKDQEALRGPVAFPRRSTIEKLPLAVSNDLSPEHPEEVIIKETQGIVGRF